jgi:hypothetical protein
MKQPAINFDAITYETAARPTGRGIIAPMSDFHKAVQATYGMESQAVSIPVPTAPAAFLSQVRATFRKHGHKLALKHKQEGGSLFLWAEEARTRKPRKKKETVLIP